MSQITWEEFSKVEFRIGEILEAVNVEKSEKLIRMMVDFGEIGQKVVFSGIRKYYSPAELVGKKTVFVVNMVPKKMMGEESGTMIFAASAFVKTTADKEDEVVSLLLLEKDLPNGSKVF